MDYSGVLRDSRKQTCCRAWEVNIWMRQSHSRHVIVMRRRKADVYDIAVWINALEARKARGSISIFTVPGLGSIGKISVRRHGGCDPGGSLSPFLPLLCRLLLRLQLALRPYRCRFVGVRIISNLSVT
jgi:hypothetical protein